MKNQNTDGILIVNIDCESSVAEALKTVLFMCFGFRVVGVIPQMSGAGSQRHPESVIRNDLATTKFIPLVICRRKSDIKKKGVHIPDVFIFEQEVNNKAESYNLFLDNIETVIQRLESLLNSEYDNSILFSELLDWCIGAFRMQLGLDEYCHGIETWNYRAEPDKLKDRISVFHNVHLSSNMHMQTFLKDLFSEMIDHVHSGIKNQSKETLQEWVASFIDSIEPKGTQVRFLKPFGKLNILLIDDEILDDPWNGLFNITQKSWDGDSNKIEWLQESLKGMGTKRYMTDLILLDLCIGDDLNSDPTGYRFLPVLRKFFPLTPIIVFSMFNDMGHIARAFKEGASWYLRKEKSEKLPRHVISIFSKPRWTREWNSCKDEYTFRSNDPNKMALEPIKQFLIASSLKSLPGNEIIYASPTEGESSSSTFIVSKSKLQSKSVVKIDSLGNAKSEYDRYQRFIRPYLDNNAGRIYNPPVIADYYAAIAYTFAGSASCDITTFKDVLCKTLCSIDTTFIQRVYKIIDELYDNLLPKLHAITVDSNCPTHPDYPNLFYSETESAAATYLAKMPNKNNISGAIISTDADTASISSSEPDSPFGIFVTRGVKRGKNSVHLFAADNLTAWNVCGMSVKTTGLFHFTPFVLNVKEAVGTVVEGDFSGSLAGERSPVCCSVSPSTIPGISFQNTKVEPLWMSLKKLFEKEVYDNNIGRSIVHGDLNTGNVILEFQEGVNSKIWLIDFATTHRDVIVIDYTELYFSVLKDMFSLLPHTNEDISETSRISDACFVDLILYSAGLRQFVNGAFSPVYSNAMNVLRHISDKVPDDMKKAYQCGLAMDLVYGTRNFRESWSKAIALKGAKAIFGMLNDKLP